MLKRFVIGLACLVLAAVLTAIVLTAAQALGYVSGLPF